jgi:hypothetical protein
VQSFLHDGHILKNFEDETVAGIAELLVNYDVTALLDKIKSIGSSQNVYHELKSLHDNFLNATDQYEKLKQMMLENADSTVGKKIQAESDAFPSGGDTELKAFYKGNKLNVFVDNTKAICRVYEELIAVPDDNRFVPFNLSTMGTNNMYYVPGFPGFQVNGKNLLANEKRLTFNWHKSPIGIPEDDIYRDMNAEINQVKTLTFNNKSTANGTSLAQKYNSY